MSVRTGTPVTPGVQLTIETAATPPGEIDDDDIEDEIDVEEMVGELADDADPGDEAPPPAVVTPAPAPSGVSTSPPAAAPQILDFDDQDRADGVVEDGDFVRVPRAKFKTIKERARAAGTREAATTIDTAVKGAGFSDLGAAMSALRDTMGRVASPSSQETGMANKDKTRTLPDRIRAKIKGIREEAQRTVALKEQEIQQLKAANQELQSQHASERTELDLKAKLRAAGFVDEDYALTLYRKEVAGKKDEEITAFMAGLGTWAGEVRKEKPYLFGQAAPQPANTGAPAASAPAAGVAPGQVAPAPSGQSPGAAAAENVTPTKNARDMSPREYQDALRAKGLAVGGTTASGQVRR